MLLTLKKIETIADSSISLNLNCSSLNCPKKNNHNLNLYVANFEVKEPNAKLIYVLVSDLPSHQDDMCLCVRTLEPQDNKFDHPSQ